MNKRITIVVFLIAVVILAFLASTMCIAYTDRAFICENTGSKHGYREWFFGVHTREWTQTSELDRFIQAKHSDQLSHRWTSYRGDGHSLLNVMRSYGHGQPGPILMLWPGMLDKHVTQLTDPEKLALYHLFSSADEKAIHSEVEKIFDNSIER
jgi:hypothetical protein